MVITLCFTCFTFNSISAVSLTGDTRKIFFFNIKYKTVDESHSARVLIGCKPITVSLIVTDNIF